MIMKLSDMVLPCLSKIILQFKSIPLAQSTTTEVCLFSKAIYSLAGLRCSYKSGDSANNGVRVLEIGPLDVQDDGFVESSLS